MEVELRKDSDPEVEHHRDFGPEEAPRKDSAASDSDRKQMAEEHHKDLREELQAEEVIHMPLEEGQSARPTKNRK